MMLNTECCPNYPDTIEVPVVKAITRDELLAFYRLYLHPTSPKRRILSLRTHPTDIPRPDQQVWPFE